MTERINVPAKSSDVCNLDSVLKLNPKLRHASCFYIYLGKIWFNKNISFEKI